jgi:phage-related protein
MREQEKLRPLLWIASAKSDLKKMPDDVTCDFGRWLYQVQKGERPVAAKILSGFGSGNVLELKKDYSDGTFRAVYTVRFKDIVVILHVSQKKSKKGIKTHKQDLELIESRLKLAEEIYEQWKEKREKK